MRFAPFSNRSLRPRCHWSGSNCVAGISPTLNISAKHRRIMTLMRIFSCHASACGTPVIELTLKREEQRTLAVIGMHLPAWELLTKGHPPRIGPHCHRCRNTKTYADLDSPHLLTHPRVPRSQVGNALSNLKSTCLSHCLKVNVVPQFCRQAPPAGNRHQSLIFLRQLW